MLRNIIIVNDFAHINGGAGNVAIKSASGLSRTGCHVTLFSAVTPIDNELRHSGVNVICLNQNDILSEPDRLKAIRQGIWNRKAKTEFARLLKDLNPKDTIIHFHAWTKSLSASLFDVTNGFKTVITLHDYFMFCPNGGLFNYQSSKICQVKPSSLRCLMTNCDSRSYPQKTWRFLRGRIQWKTIKKNKDINIIYISNLNRDVSYRWLKDIANRWYYVQNPITFDTARHADISMNRKYLFIARLSSEKGIGLFCRAITDLHLEGCVLGDGYLREKMQKEYPNIEFAGWVSGKEKERLILKGKALVFPSLWYEGAPLSIIEMKSYGIPCIVPDRCAASEEVEDGKTGFVFETGNIDSLKNAILRCENADMKEIQEEIGRTFNPDRYKLSNHCKRLIEVYEDILSKT